MIEMSVCVCEYVKEFVKGFCVIGNEIKKSNKGIKGRVINYIDKCKGKRKIHIVSLSRKVIEGGLYKDVSLNRFYYPFFGDQVCMDGMHMCL